MHLVIFSPATTRGTVADGLAVRGVHAPVGSCTRKGVRLGIEIRPIDGQASAADAGLAPRHLMDHTSRTIVGAGLATAIIALLGVLLGAWRIDWLGLVMIVAGLAAAGVAWLGVTGPDDDDSLPSRDIELAAGVVAGVLGVLGLCEMLFDMMSLDQRGGIVGAGLAVALAVSGLALFIGCLRRWSDPMDIVVGDERSVRVAYAGVGLVVVGWLAMVTIGSWTLSAGASVLAFALLAGLILRWSTDEAADGSPVAGAWVAVAFALVGTMLGLSHLMLLAERVAAFGPLDTLAVLAYAVGVALTLVGSVWTAYERTIDAQERSSIRSGDMD
jgi:hypothetical protein